MKIQAEKSVRNYKQELKRKLVEKLLEANAFWSYCHVCAEIIPDEKLIEKTFITLDLSDIALLFVLYSRDYIRMFTFMFEFCIATFGWHL